MRVLTALALSLACLFLVAACRPALKPDRSLRLRVQPLTFNPGTVVTVSAEPARPVALRWVSGTVELMGAPVMPFSWDAAQKAWAFKTQIPAFVSIPPGSYTVRAWGEDALGERWEGRTQVQVQ